MDRIQVHKLRKLIELKKPDYKMDINQFYIYVEHKGMIILQMFDEDIKRAKFEDLYQKLTGEIK